VCVGLSELLSRLELFQAANELVAFTPDKHIQQLNATNTSTYGSCASCRRPIATPSASAGYGL
jgi:hypothetical protein